MVLRLLAKNPILVIGALAAFIFLTTYRGKYSLRSRAEKLVPTSCRALQVKLDRRIPEHWSSHCRENNLIVEITEENTLPEGKEEMILYRMLANSMVHIAHYSPSDNLERTHTVAVTLHHPRLTLKAVTEGKLMVKLQTMKDPQLIGEHLKATVQTQAVAK